MHDLNSRPCSFHGYFEYFVPRISKTQVSCPPHEFTKIQILAEAFKNLAFLDFSNFLKYLRKKSNSTLYRIQMSHYDINFQHMHVRQGYSLTEQALKIVKAKTFHSTTRSCKVGGRQFEKAHVPLAPRPAIPPRLKMFLSLDSLKVGPGNYQI